MRAPSLFTGAAVSFFFSILGGLWVGLAVKGAKNLGDAVERPVEILAGNDKRRCQADDGVVRLLRQHAGSEQPLASHARIAEGRLDLDAGEKTKAAYFFDRGAVDRFEALQHVRAEDAAALDQAFILDHAQRDEPDRRGERIAAEGRAMRAGREHIHQLARAEESRD